MNAPDSPELTVAEEIVLAFHAWKVNGRHDLLLRALRLRPTEYDAAIDRLLELGMIMPEATRQ